VELDLRGHPLHTRALSLELRQRADGALGAAGVLLDLRKRSFVPVAGDLQAAGVLHHMQIAAVLDPATLELLSIEVAQPSVAFEPSAVTAGESCRDPAPRLQALVGARLDDGFARRLGSEIGGTRGCTHVLTLAQLLGATLPWVRDWEAGQPAAAPARAPGERIFRRDLVIDGARGERGLALAAQLQDLHLRPAPPVAFPSDRFAGQLELRLLAEIDGAHFALASARGAERWRARGELERAAWRPLDAELAGLPGLSLRPGVTAELVRRFAERPAQRPLLALLLNLTPAFYQCLACSEEDRALEPLRRPSLVGLSGTPDSCYMWRRGGALDRRR
jgi:hypothetical protein